MLTEISLSIPASDLSPTERAQLLVPTLAALSDENRLTILLTLAETSMTNRQLHEATGRSEERRVGKEGRSRGAPDRAKKKKGQREGQGAGSRSQASERRTAHR